MILTDSQFWSHWKGSGLRETRVATKRLAKGITQILKPMAKRTMKSKLFVTNK